VQCSLSTLLGSFRPSPRPLPGPPRTNFPATGYKTWIEGCSGGRLAVNTTAFRVLRFNPGWSRSAGTCPVNSRLFGAISAACDWFTFKLTGIQTWGDPLYNQFVYVLPKSHVGFLVGLVAA
jgi:hypothetical protein